MYRKTGYVNSYISNNKTHSFHMKHSEDSTTIDPKIEKPNSNKMLL